MRGRRSLSLAALVTLALTHGASVGAAAAQEALPRLAARSGSAARALAALRADLDDVLAAPAWRRAAWGVLAVSLERGDTLFARDPDRLMVPASNVKLMTTAAALHHLGADYRFRTFVLATGPVVNGVLEGDLVLYGTGDPGLSDRFYPSRGAVMDSLAAALEVRGVRRIAGRVLGDGTFFAGPDRLPAWDEADLNDWFAAASPALSYNDNVVTLRVEAGAPGLPPRVHTLPDHGGVAIANEALTARGRPASRFGIERGDPLAPIRVHGEMARTAADAWRRMTVQDPVLFAAHALTRALGDAGITVDGGPDTVAGAARSPLGPARIFQAGSAGDPRVLAEHLSPPLLDYLAVINQESHNLFADLVLRTLGRVVEGEGSYEAGVRVVERYLTDEVGVAAGSVRLVDGSGLAADNRASPASFVTLLGHLAHTPEWASFRETLPEAGSRQLRRMQRTMAAGNLRAKTGTIRGVSALSGVVRTHDGDHIAFSIVGNELPSAWGAKRLEDRIAVRLAELTRSPSTSTVEPASAVGAARERDGSRRQP